MYRFTADKSAGSWDSTKVVSVALADDVSELKSALNDITNDSRNKLPIASLVTASSGVTRNYADGVLKSTGTANSGGGRLSAFTPQFTLETGTYTLSKNVVSGIASTLFVIFANDDNYITLPSANNSITFTIETDKVASISFAYSTGADYTNEYQIQIEVGEVATQFQKPSYKSAVDLIARAAITTEREKLTHVKVMSYNVGSYNMGVSQDFTPEQQAEITKVYRKFFNDQNCDILGLQEAKTNFSSGNPVNPQIYSPLYTNIVDSINTSAIKSRFHFIESGTFDISTDTADNRHCAYCICEIAGHEVYVLDTHFSPISAELRQDNYTEVLEILSKHEFFICFGDFNCASDYTEYNPFTNAGYHIANCGYLGVLNTMGSQIGTNNPLPNDNIVTSGNIIISGVKVLDELYSTLKSDHLPIVADLIFNA